MSPRKTHLIIIAFMIALSASLIGWSYWPLGADENQVFINPDNMILSGANDPQPAVLEFRTLSTFWPRSVRIGDSGVVRLDFSLDPVMHQSIGNPQLVDVYDLYNVLVDVRLEMPGAVVAPPGLFSQPLRPGQNITFNWRIYPNDVGQVSGTLWVYLRFVPRDMGEQEQVLIAVKQFKVESFALFGLGVGVVRVIGGIGFVLSIILSLPFVDRGLRGLFVKRGK